MVQTYIPENRVILTDLFARGSALFSLGLFHLFVAAGRLCLSPLLGVSQAAFKSASAHIANGSMFVIGRT